MRGCAVLAAADLEEVGDPQTAAVNALVDEADRAGLTTSGAK